MVIRLSTRTDMPQIETLYPAAFPDEDLLPLVTDLLDLPEGVLSLVATVDDSVIVRQGKGQDVSGRELLTVPDRLDFRA